MVVIKDGEGAVSEQRKKYEEIIELLLSAGYFRARISTLSEFDKVVGGLCWSIVHSGVEVDVDILFTENATIGQRIALSEAIVSAMRKMKCPHQLQPHQIQGGIGGADYVVIFPVMVWLIKKFFGLREERDIQLRSFSTLQFSRDYKFPHEADITEVTPELAKVLGRNQAVRKYKRTVKSNDSEVTRVHSCLLEYGELLLTSAAGTGGKGEAGSSSSSGSSSRGGKSSSSSGGTESDAYEGGASGAAGFSALEGGDISLSLRGISHALGALGGGAAGGADALSGFEKKLMQEAIKAQKEEAAYNEMLSKQESELMEGMQSLEGSTGLVGGSLAGTLLGMGGEDISQFATEYAQQLEESAAAMEKALQGGKMGVQAAYKRQRQNLLNQLATLEASNSAKDAETSLVLERLRHLEEETAGAVDYNAKLRAQIDKLSALEANSAQQDDLRALKSLIVLNESLKSQEAAFKAGCKAQLAEFQARIKALQEADKPDSVASKKLSDIEDMHGKIMFKYDKLRQMLAEANLEVSANARIIDDIPTRSELMQYERRFSELYQQVAWKLEETKKYFAMYNTQETTLTVMQKNVKTLDSIHDNFHDAMKSAEGKRQFFTQVSAVTKGVGDSARQQEGVLKARTKQADTLRENFQHLVDEQRAYYQMVKDFQSECEKNDWLSAKLEAGR